MAAALLGRFTSAEDSTLRSSEKIVSSLSEAMARTRVAILSASLLLLSGLALSKGQKKLNINIAVITAFTFKIDSSQVDLNLTFFLSYLKMYLKVTFEF